MHRASPARPRPSRRRRARGPWIEVVDEAAAAGHPALASLYAGLGDPRGHVDNILKIHSLNPASLVVHADFYRLVMYGRSPLTRVQREMIAVTVSAVNRCHY